MATGYPVLDTLENLANDYAAQLSAAIANGDAQAIAQNRSNLTEIFKSLSNKQTQFESRIADAKANGDTELLAELRLKNTATIKLLNTTAAYLDSKTADPGSNTATDAVVTDSDQTGTTVPTGTTKLTKEETNNIDPYNPNAWGSEGAAVPYKPNPAQQATLKSPTSTGNQAGGPLTKADQSNKKNTSTAEDTAEITYKTTENRLHQYNNYTYGLSLHALTQADYKQLNNNPKQFKINHTLISSASRHHATRSEFFTDDFYFEELKLGTVIGLNATSRSGNAIEISFTIIEPYGMTLINRLLDLSEKTLQIENYLQVPYLLEIDFFGYNDAGAQEKKIAELNKKIPIKLINMKMRATVKGTEYQITAVPFNHQANFSNTQSLKTTVEVTAGTVGEYLNEQGANAATIKSFANSIQTEVKKDDERKEAIASIKITNYDDGTELVKDSDPTLKTKQATTPVVKDKTSTPAGSASNLNFVIKTDQGLAAAYNAWYQALIINKEKNITVPDEIFFKITSDKIKNALLVPPKKLNENKKPMNDDPSAIAVQLKNDNPNGPAAVQSGQETRQTFTVNAGTSIQSIVEQVITNSEYITNQLKRDGDQNKDMSIPTSAKDLSKAVGNKNINWFKVVPHIELTKFDNQRQAWGKKITFIISEYIYYNTSDDRAAKSQLPNAVKDYQYFYTGKNQDVISFDIDFNALFFTAIQVDKNAKAATSKALNNNDANTASDSSEISIKTGYGNPTNPEQIPMPLNVSNSSGGNLGSAEAQKNTSFRDSLYSQMGGDMLNLKLNIIGDPDFIKQDDILYTALTTDYKPNQQFVDGEASSLVMDRGAIYCRVTFKTPADINEATGGLAYYKGDSTSSFSGLYRVLKVSSEFRSGKFMQTLETVRQINQPGDGKKSTDNVERDKTIKAPEQSKNAKQKTNNVNLSTARVEEKTRIKTKEKFKTPPVATTVLRELPESDLGTFDLQTVVDTAVTVAIGDNSLATGESIIGYSI